MSDTEQMVTIPKSEYEGLLRSFRELCELDAGGVDNWGGYEYLDWHYINTGERLNDE